jgi:hypothetical protein
MHKVMNLDDHTWAAAALRAFLKRTFARLAAQSKKDSKAFADVLRGLM